ncbi:hypothetical protein ABIB37_000144 [Agrococcus sp. UYP10]|uniref:PLDc N-terminal domain-containing protein n=1 Tax=Agrococcus sp. UYP10 TaxID=1756355 RepID=UPI0033933BCE
MLLEVVNPLLPTGYDVIWTVAVLALLALAAVAIVQVLREPTLSGLGAVLWLLVILALPVLGAVAWFVLRPRRAAGQLPSL